MLTYIMAAVVTAGLALMFLPLQEDKSVMFGEDRNRNQEAARAVRLLSRRELSVHNGEQGSEGLFLALLGQVFDVQKGSKHYGPGGAYHALAGRDASLAFITGDFTERGLTDDVSSLSALQVVVLYDWLEFYQREYQSVGVVVGRFYSETGRPTEQLLRVEASLAQGKQIKAETEREKMKYPSCNSEWSGARGGRVWCSTKSGGVERHWTGVPRRLFSPGVGSIRCVCVKDSFSAELDPNLQTYDGCPPHAESCSVTED